jgi:predicted thioesterase
VTFQISARDEREVIARGLLKRAVIRIDRFAQRVQGKST